MNASEVRQDRVTRYVAGGLLELFARMGFIIINGSLLGESRHIVSHLLVNDFELVLLIENLHFCRTSGSVTDFQHILD